MKKTQIKAFRHINQKSHKRNQVLSVIHYMGGATFFELVKVLKWPVNCITGRVNELCKMGLVADSGVVKKNPKTKRSAVVWVANV